MRADITPTVGVVLSFNASAAPSTDVYWRAVDLLLAARAPIAGASASAAMYDFFSNVSTADGAGPGGGAHAPTALADNSLPRYAAHQAPSQRRHAAELLCALRALQRPATIRPLPDARLHDELPRLLLAAAASTDAASTAIRAGAATAQYDGRLTRRSSHLPLPSVC